MYLHRRIEIGPPLSLPPLRRRSLVASHTFHCVDELKRKYERMFISRCEMYAELPLMALDGDMTVRFGSVRIERRMSNEKTEKKIHRGDLLESRNISMITGMGDAMLLPSLRMGKNGQNGKKIQY